MGRQGEARGEADKRLILIGYWFGPGEPGYPVAADFVDPDWDPDERSDVIDHLQRGFVKGAFMGISECRFCGKNNGSLELTDGTYTWPEGLAHYLIDHEVRLPSQFVEHVQRMAMTIADATVDKEWWKSVAPPGRPD